MHKLLKSVPIGILSAIVIIAIAYFSLAPRPFGDVHIPLFPHSDKVAHLLMYFTAVIVFLIDYSKFRIPHHTKLNMEMAILASAMLLGLVMEVLQLVMQVGRGYDILDIAANCTGALLGFTLMKWKGLKSIRRILLNDKHHHHHRHHRHNKDN